MHWSSNSPDQLSIGCVAEILVMVDNSIQESCHALRKPGTLHVTIEVYDFDKEWHKVWDILCIQPAGSKIFMVVAAKVRYCTWFRWPLGWHGMTYFNKFIALQMSSMTAICANAQASGTVLCSKNVRRPARHRILLTIPPNPDLFSTSIQFTTTSQFWLPHPWIFRNLWVLM